MVLAIPARNFPRHYLSCEMNMKKTPLIKLLGLILFVFLYQSPAICLPSDTEAKTEITNTLIKWQEDFNAKNIEGVCGMFARDLIANHAGVPEINYNAQCSQLRSSLTQTDKTYYYEPPLIEQVIVQGDLAIVRVIWTLKITSKNPSETRVDIAKSLDIFKRQKDGSWKLFIYYSFSES